MTTSLCIFFLVAAPSSKGGGVIGLCMKVAAAAIGSPTLERSVLLNPEANSLAVFVVVKGKSRLMARKGGGAVQDGGAEKGAPKGSVAGKS
jgi:hypothetical protein